jgi:endonuclease-3 related protein
MEAATQAGQASAAVSQRRKQRSCRRDVDPEQTVRSIYRTLSRAWGRQHWWPAESPFEVIVGAILVQNTAWTNVERAIANLREAEALRVDAIREIPAERLEQLVRPSGYFRQKAARLKEFARLVDAEFSGSVELMLAMPTERLREKLLAQKGIGPETADSILLYAGQHPIFVVDAYTRRVLERHDVVRSPGKYNDVRALVETALRSEEWLPRAEDRSLQDGGPAPHSPSAMSTAQRTPMAQVYNEMHGLFVQLGKHFCTKREPKCDKCPLGPILEQPVVEQSPQRVRRRASKARRTTFKKSAKQRV